VAEVEAPEDLGGEPQPVVGQSEGVVGGGCSFRELFDAQFGYVWNVLKRLGVAERDLEDVCQMVFLQVHGNLDAFDASRPLRPWLFSFAYHAASNYRGLARHRIDLMPAPPEPSDPAPGADEQLILRQELEFAEEALQCVALERRAVLLLHEVEGLSIPEVARSVGVPLNTAYSRLRLGRLEYEQAVHRLRAKRGSR
jgi:RNA polymerase sigma-70 factor, ECF subfamily